MYCGITNKRFVFAWLGCMYFVVHILGAVKWEENDTEEQYAAIRVFIHVFLNKSPSKVILIVSLTQKLLINTT